MYFKAKYFKIKIKTTYTHIYLIYLCGILYLNFKVFPLYHSVCNLKLDVQCFVKIFLRKHSRWDSFSGVFLDFWTLQSFCNVPRDIDQGSVVEMFLPPEFLMVWGSLWFAQLLFSMIIFMSCKETVLFWFVLLWLRMVAIIICCHKDKILKFRILQNPILPFLLPIYKSWVSSGRLHVHKLFHYLTVFLLYVCLTIYYNTKLNSNLQTLFFTKTLHHSLLSYFCNFMLL